MEFIKESEIAQIILRTLTEEISAAEQKILDEWITRSETNRKTYGRIIDGRTFTEQVEISQHTNKEITLKKVDHMIRRGRMKRIVAAGTAAAAVAAVWIMIFQYGGVDIANLDEAPAGTTKAILSYGDSRVMLTEEEQPAEWEKYITSTEIDMTEVSVPRVKVEIPRGGEYKLRLPDGTEVWLNSESTIEYPKIFSDAARQVKLTGEAFFEVTKDISSPFEVEFGDVLVRVLGTSFNISAYNDDAEAMTTLVSGKVEVLRGQAVVELLPGKQAVFSRNSKDIIVNDVDPELYTMWTKGLFKFQNMRLEDICTKLSRWYNVDFEFEGVAGNERFSGGTWKYLPLGEFLSGIEMVTNVNFHYDEKKVFVTKK